MVKMSAYDIKNFLSTLPDFIEKQAEENIELKEKVAQYEKKERAVKLAQEMEEKGMNSHLDFNGKVEALMDQDLDTVEKAINWSSTTLKVASTEPGRKDEAYLFMLQ
jgi:uncharacterized protein YigA (DUF484 family)